ncbi:MAG: GerMN domain-containing protein [Clostridia bacterium]|nr:GerMN domain-containing protein [Clostridia bacterium]
MKKLIVCVALTLAFIAAAEPHIRAQLLEKAQDMLGRGPQAVQEKTQAAFSEQIGSHDTTDMLDVTLYFRFAGTNLLGAQRAQLDIRREETVARSIVQRLIDGPAVTHGRLNGLFPQGTEIISVSGEATTAFVTLSRGFLGRPDGAPADWEDSFAWQEEAALRRRLAVQSIVLALTEGGRYQRVQMYIADGDDDIPQRIPMAYFDPYTSDASLVLAASTRDESVMLTPGRTMKMILDAWMERDYALMHALLAPGGEDELPTQSAFESKMNEMGISLLDYSASGGTVSIDGRTATVVVDAQIRSGEGGDAQIIRESVPLVRTQDNWTIAEEVLLSLMIRD